MPPPSDPVSKPARSAIFGCAQPPHQPCARGSAFEPPERSAIFGSRAPKRSAGAALAPGHLAPERCGPEFQLSPSLSASAAQDARNQELARLLPLWPSEIADTSLEGRRRLVAKLERALKAERRRGRAGHWTYDLARHAALLAAWKRERTDVMILAGQHTANTRG